MNFKLQEFVVWIYGAAKIACLILEMFSGVDSTSSGNADKKKGGQE